MIKTRTEALEALAADWDDMARGTSQFDAALRVCALKVRDVLAAYPETEPDYQYGVATKWGTPWEWNLESAKNMVRRHEKSGTEATLMRRIAAAEPGEWEEVR